MEKDTAKSNNPTIIALISFVFIIVIAYFFIYPYVGELKKASINLDAKTKEVTETKNKITTLKSMESKFSSSSDMVKKLGLAVPGSDQMPEILVQLETMASASGLKVSSVQPSKEAAKGVVPVTVTLQGDYKGFTSMLAKMETNIRPMNIKAINMAAAPQKESALLNFTLNLEILKVQ